MALETLLTEEQIQQGIVRLAQQILADHGDEPVILVGILKGSVYFLADLSRRLPTTVEIDFVQASSYLGQRESSGIVRIQKDIDISVEGRNVILVEDIIDSGLTVQHLRELFGTRKPKSLKVAALLSKSEARTKNVQVEYVGFEIPNVFVVGYGLDEKERYRNLPYIAILRDVESP